MTRKPRTRAIAAVLAVIGALLLPATTASAGGPTAVKSGALVNYTSTGKIRIAKKLFVPFVCSANCSVVSNLTLKGPGVKVPDTRSATLNANVVAAHFLQPNGPLLKAMRAAPGRFKVVSSITATDVVTGATDTIANTFRLKR